MAIYSGQINLINVRDGAPGQGTPGVGITRSSVEYTYSKDGVNPPENNWQTSIPEVPRGYYLWTKTTLFFSDGNNQISYTASYQGENGASADSVDSYFLKTNQKEIVKFIQSNGEVSLTPEKISLSVYRIDYNSSSGESQVYSDLYVNNLNVSIYNPSSGIWIGIPQDIKNEAVLLNESSIFEIDLKKIIEDTSDQNDFKNILLDEETVFQISYLLNIEIDGQRRNYSLTSYLDVRYGINKDMASLSLEAGKIVASIQDAKLNFGGDGLTIQNGAFRIEQTKDGTTTPLLYSDGGNLCLLGNVYAEGGYFKGKLEGATGTFSGALEAASGTFTGKLEAATGSFSGEITAEKGTIGGFNIGATQLTSTSLNTNGAPNIVLDGSNGQVQVENIILGTGAKIKEYITIGSLEEDFENIIPEFEFWEAGLIGTADPVDRPLQTGGSFDEILSTPQSIAVESDSTYLLQFEGVTSFTIGMYDSLGVALSREYYSSGSVIIPEKCTQVRFMISGYNNYSEYKNAFETGVIKFSFSKSKRVRVDLKAPASIGDSYISVLENGGDIFSLKADGSLSIGNGNNTIIISGSKGYIMSQSFQDGLGWKISNTESIFNDVTVRGSIRASVLEYGETQAIGGALLVRPSSRILKTDYTSGTTTLKLEELKGFKVGDYCRIDFKLDNGIKHSFFKVTAVDETNSTITVEGNASTAQGQPVVNFGQVGDNVGIAINGSVDGSFSTPQSISVFEFNPETELVTPRIILGKLPDAETIYGYAAGTYGLYAENVLLKGSLVTQASGDSGPMYSGISTVYSGAEVPKSTRLAAKMPNNFVASEILLWAGAEKNSKKSIEESKFFVDRNGNMYAGSGYFEGTIITDATIKASIIETTTLRGYGEKPALKIEDAAKGIYFTTKKEDGTDEVVFEVNKDSIVANVPNFIFNNNFSIGGNGSLVVPNLYVIGEGTSTIDVDDISQALMFEKDKIIFTNKFNSSKEVESYMDFSSGITFHPTKTEPVLSLSNQEVRIKGDTTSLYIENSIRYNEIMVYEPVKNDSGVLVGYDLYIE